MDTPGYVVLSRLSSQQRALDAVANNLANLETPAYQAERLLFSRYVERGAIGTRGGPTQYTIDRATWRETAPGPMSTTGNPFDLALRGPGYFAVETPRGDRYTRAGRFTAGWSTQKAMRCSTNAASHLPSGPRIPGSRCWAMARSVRRTG